MKDAIRHLDSRFATLSALSHAQRPPKGWIRAIRDALGMTTAQYAKRLGVSQPRIVELEKSEQGGSVTLNTLQRAAEALGCRLVYALVPERPLAEVVTKRAAEVAERQSRAVEQTMRLEDQAVEDNQAARALREQAIEDLLKRPARLWDDE
ncbi:mobile mystery protein A [Bradyrhizobium archetypum]|uniref:Mobile mystery protein A n=1 Tax=Bradyrhizobium archetypum TaxID=2721160 RepID=A0A7Y4M0C3_9BRAD|nr:mobile mystery protein A [Bradyrhizobium archetypum]NOJ44715.1 mobile mystery protein A [Bradyrhizobium archetypum]